jgi:hypothetical protein
MRAPDRTMQAPDGWLPGWREARSPIEQPEARWWLPFAAPSPTDLELRAGHLKDIPLPRAPCSASRPPAPSTRPGPASPAPARATASRPCCSAWAVTPSTRWRRSRPADAVSWLDAAALPSSAEAAAGVLRQLHLTRGETLLLIGGGGSVGIIATQLAVAQGVSVISAVGEHDDTLARELGATPVRYGPGLASRVRALGPVDAGIRRGRHRHSGRGDRPGRRTRPGHHLVRSGRCRLRRHALPAHARPRSRYHRGHHRPAGRRQAPAARAHQHAHAAGRPSPPPARERHRPPAHHPHPPVTPAARPAAHGIEARSGRSRATKAEAGR